MSVVADYTPTSCSLKTNKVCVCSLELKQESGGVSAAQLSHLHVAQSLSAESLQVSVLLWSCCKKNFCFLREKNRTKTSFHEKSQFLSFVHLLIIFILLQPVLTKGTNSCLFNF